MEQQSSSSARPLVIRLATLIPVSLIALFALWSVLPLLQSLMPMGKDYLNFKDNSTSLRDIVMVGALIFSMAIFMFLQKFPGTQHGEFVFKTSLVGCMLAIFSKLSGVLSEPFMRLAIYFLWCYPIFIADSLLRMRLKSNTRLLLSIVIVLFFICYSVLSINSSESLTPYVMRAIL